MRLTAIHRLSAATAAGIVLSLLATGEAEAYTFTKIADNSGTLYPFSLDPPFNFAINNRGTVVFSAGNFPPPPGVPYYGHQARLFTGNGGPLTVIATDSYLDASAINDEDTVAFWSVSGPHASQPLQYISTSSGGAITTIFTTSTYLGALRGPAINNEGTVVFSNFDGLNSFLYISNGGVLTTVADSSGSFSRFYDSDLSINDAGTVVFGAGLDAGGEGIFTANGGSFTTIVDTSSPFSGFGNPAINNAGTVVFSATLDAGGGGIFTGPDPVADKVIATGDILFGSMVLDLPNFGFYGYGKHVINDAGQIVFYAELADGTRGIYRADPESEPPSAVPEPTSVLSLLAMGALGVVSRRKRQFG